MNKRTRKFLEDLCHATVVFGIPLAFVVLGVYAIGAWGIIGLLPVGFGCTFGFVFLANLADYLK
jgi:hypothetical protein